MQKGTTECSKSALPDDGFGKDFFNSWKLGKVENESIDFDFETVPKNKMGSFKFDELDSFELSGNFEKLASFKLDIPNLDFSSMSKKNEKTRENSPRDISKGKDFKEDKFSFDFDFNSFEFDSKLQKDDRRHSTCATVREHSSKNVEPDSSKNITADTNVPTSSEPDKLTRLNKESFDFAQKTALSTTKQISSVEDNQKEPGLSTIHGETSHPMHMGKEDSADSLGFHLQSFSGDSSGEALPADKISILQVDAAKCTSMMQKGDPMQPICSSASSPSRSSSPVDSFNSGCGPKSCMKQVQNKGAEAEIQKHQVKTQLANGLIQLKKDVSSIRCSKNSTMTLKIGEEKLKSDKNLVSPLLKSSFQHNPINAKNMSEPLLQKLTSASPKISSAENDKANLNLRTRLGSQTMRSVSNNVALDPYSILTSSVAKTMQVNKNKSNSSMPREVKSVRFLEKRIECPVTTASKQILSATKERPSFPDTSLKRKLNEESVADLETSDPLNCVKLSAKRQISFENYPESRKETTSEMKSAEAVQNAASNEKPASLNTIPEIKVPESAGLSSHVDFDDNLRIAETFMKELDNICSKLKMKREESKELQVRSIINNNALLLLNYPMLEEKKLQVFASSLLLKEI